MVSAQGDVYDTYEFGVWRDLEDGKRCREEVSFEFLGLQRPANEKEAWLA